MPDEPLIEPQQTTVAVDGSERSDRQTLALHAEEVSVAKRARRKLVRATRTTRSREAVVEEDLTSESVVIERVPMNKAVDAIPPIREEGDVTIMPVVEEVVVIERRLILKEEVRLRRVRSVRRHTETVVLRQQQVAVTRTELGDE